MFSLLYMSSTYQMGWPATCEVIKGCEEIAGNCILELVCLQVQGQAAQEGICLQPCALSIALLAFPENSALWQTSSRCLLVWRCAPCMMIQYGQQRMISGTYY